MDMKTLLLCVLLLWSEMYDFKQNEGEVLVSNLSDDTKWSSGKGIYSVDNYYWQCGNN